MAQRNKPAQRVKRSCDLTDHLDGWLETSDSDVVVCSLANCGKVSSSPLQLDVLQDDHSSSCPPKSRYNPLPFINNEQHRQSSSHDNRAAAVVVDCSNDEQFIAYGRDNNPKQQQCSSTSGQYFMSVSSSLPSVAPLDHVNKRSCNPITVPDQEDIPNLSDHLTSGDNSSDHVMSGDSSDPTISHIKRKRRKLIRSKGSVSNWQPTPINIEGEKATLKNELTSGTSSSPITINPATTYNVSPITVEDNNLLGSHDCATTEGCSSPTAMHTCDLTDLEGCGSPTTMSTCDLTNVKECGSLAILHSHDHAHKHVGDMATNRISGDRARNKSTLNNSNNQSYTRQSLTSVKTSRFYSQYSSSVIKNKPKPQTVFGVQSKLKGYKIPRKSQSSQYTDAIDDDDGNKKTRQLSLASALSQLDQPTNTGKSSNINSSQYYRGMGLSLTRPSLNKQQRSHHMSKEVTMLTSVNLDCSKVNVGTLTGIAEGATLSVDSLTFQLDDGCTQHFIVINPMVNAVECCKINLQQQPYIMQLLLYSGPARQLSSKVKLSKKVYDPESSDDHLKFIQLLFDLKPSSESCEAINKVLDRISKQSNIGWTIERDTVSSDEVYHPPPTPASGRSSNNTLPLKRYATRSKTVKSPLQVIKDNYTISDDDDDSGDHKVDNDDDDDFESITDTAKTSRRSTRSSSIARIKPEDDKLLLSYRPGTLARAVSIFLSDLDCLHEGEFLNDKIIDFYLKYLWYNKLPDDSSRSRVHVFSPFFYTRLVNSSFGGGKKGGQYDAELLHSRVKNWTKNVDLFSKELVILPVCQSSHWYVAVICHAGLFEATSSSTSLLDTSVVITGNESSNDIIAGILEDTSSAAIAGHPSTVIAQTDYHDDSNVVNKALRPCILILDSLGGHPRTPTIAKIRKYLTAEWKHKHNDKGEKDFSTFRVLSQSKLKVPLQENSSDCGLFVLQYVETLLQRVIIENEAIPTTTDRWFTLADISKKRNDLHKLITTLPDNNT